MNKNKSKLEEKVIEGIYGEPELKREEKKRFLGEFKERVIRYLTYDQVMEPEIYPEILEAIRDPEAKELIIDRRVDLEAAHDYIKLASENDLSFRKIDSPELKGDIALVVVSDHAVEIGERKVLSRKERLRSRGISDKIIKNVGAKLCDQCWSQLAKKAPEELVNYEKMSWLDKILGTECICKN